MLAVEPSAADGLMPSAAPAALRNQAPPDRDSADDKSSLNRGVEPDYHGESPHLTGFLPTGIVRRHDFGNPHQALAWRPSQREELERRSMCRACRRGPQ